MVKQVNCSTQLSIKGIAKSVGVVRIVSIKISLTLITQLDTKHDDNSVTLSSG